MRMILVLTICIIVISILRLAAHLLDADLNTLVIGVLIFTVVDHELQLQNRNKS